MQLIGMLPVFAYVIDFDDRIEIEPDRVPVNCRNLKVAQSTMESRMGAVAT